MSDPDAGTHRDEAAAGQDLGTVHVIDVPVALHLRAREHLDGLQREFRLVAEYLRHDPVPTVPRRLVDLVTSLTRTYGGFGANQQDVLEEAAAAGRERVTLTFRVPREVAGAVTALDAMLDEADEYCRAGQHLLTLAAPPDVVAYRRWYLRQFVDQLAGGEPVPWGVAHRGTSPPGTG